MEGAFVTRSPKNRNTCFVCESASITKTERGLTQKLLDRLDGPFRCLACLADYLDTTEDTLREKAIELKEQGCSFF